MQIELEMRGKTQRMELNDDATGEDLLKKLNLFPDGVIIIVDGKPIPYKEKIRGNRVRIIRVASGG